MTRTAIAPLIRGLTPDDRERVAAMTRAASMFRPSEVSVALEVFDAALGIGRRADPDYEAAGVELDGELAGWACWGPTPCTVGTYDLYWIVVAPEHQGRGLGGALIQAMERQVDGRARLIVVETAGREDYASTRRFYEARGYFVLSSIPDYYEPGDDLIVYGKRFPTSRIPRTPAH